MAKCANCGWDWFKHDPKNRCPGQHLKPNEKAKRFTPFAKHGGQ